MYSSEVGIVVMGNFYTDAISRDTRFRLATRVCDASLLEPATRQLVAAIVSAASRMGIELRRER